MNLICGINPVMEALAAGSRHFDRLLVVKGMRNQRVSEAIARASQLGIPLRFEPRETLDRMAGGIPHQGLDRGGLRQAGGHPREAAGRGARTPALLVVLDGVEDPRNLGAILRTVDAAGADGVLLPDRHSAGLSETVSRASAGGLEHVKVARIGNVSQAIDELKARGVWVVGFDASGTERWDAVDYRRPIALVLGGEGRGIRRLVRERCDHLVSLPLFGHVGSLNVSVAAGIALYEVMRQRGAVPSHVRPIPARAAAGAGHVVGPGEDDAEHDPGDRAPARAAYGDDEDDDDDGRRPAAAGRRPGPPGLEHGTDGAGRGARPRRARRSAAAAAARAGTAVRIPGPRAGPPRASAACPGRRRATRRRERPAGRHAGAGGSAAVRARRGHRAGSAMRGRPARRRGRTPDGGSGGRRTGPGRRRDGAPPGGGGPEGRRRPRRRGRRAAPVSRPGPGDSSGIVLARRWRLWYSRGLSLA